MTDITSELSKVDLNFESDISSNNAATDVSAKLQNDSKGKAGRRNQALTKPITLDDSTGAVLVRKSTGKTKIRKGQTSAEYEEQLRQYFVEEEGPTRTEVSWMDNVQVNDSVLNDSQLELKQVRQKLVSHAHRYYYKGRYLECLRLCEQLLERFEPYNKKDKIVRELNELKYMIEKSRCRLLSVSSDS